MTGRACTACQTRTSRFRPRAATFADELIPSEVDAELNDGELPKEVDRRARRPGQGTRACARPTCRPSWAAWGTPRCSRCWCKSRSGGSPTRWPGWHPPRRPGCRPWRPRFSWRSSSSRRSAGEREECYAITEEGAGLGRRRHRGDRAAGRRRLPAQRREVARHLVQRGRLRVLPGQAGRRRARRRARDVPGRPAQPRRPGGAHPGVLALDRPPPPDRGVHRRAGARDAPGRRRGRRDELRLRVVPVRADDGGRALPGRGAAADRGDDAASRPSGRCRASRSRCSARSRPCWPTA